MNEELLSSIKPSDFSWFRYTQMDYVVEQRLASPSSAASTISGCTTVSSNTPVGRPDASTEASSLSPASVSRAGPSPEPWCAVKALPTTPTGVRTKSLRSVTVSYEYYAATLTTPHSCPTARAATGTTSATSSPSSTTRRTPKQTSSQSALSDAGSPATPHSDGGCGTAVPRSPGRTTTTAKRTGHSTTTSRLPSGGRGCSPTAYLSHPTTKRTVTTKDSGSYLVIGVRTSKRGGEPTPSSIATALCLSSVSSDPISSQDQSTITLIFLKCSHRCSVILRTSSLPTTPPTCSPYNKMGLGRTRITMCRVGWAGNPSPSSPSAAGPATHPTSAPSNRCGRSSPVIARRTARSVSPSHSSALAPNGFSGTSPSLSVSSCSSQTESVCGSSDNTISGASHSELVSALS